MKLTMIDVVNAYKNLFSNIDNWQAKRAIDYIEKVYNPNTPSHELSLFGLWVSTINASRLLNETESSILKR